MPLPGGTIPLAPSGGSPPPAFLVRFPEDTWNKLGQAAREGTDVTITVDGDIVSSWTGSWANDQQMNIAGETIQLDAHAGQPSELYTFTGGKLNPIGTAGARLSIPFTAESTTRAADKLRQKNEALDRQKELRADRVAGKPPRPGKPVSSGPGSSYQPPPAALPMTRAASGPSAITLGTTERIPLKTRIVQLLALGPATMEELLDRTGGNPDDVVRVVNVVG